MAKTAASYSCTACGAPSLRWTGRCIKCGEFGTVTERAPAGRGGEAVRPRRAARPVTQLAAEHITRSTTGIGEFDRVLGGGLVPGQVVLLAGEPGVGKSTLLLEVAQAMARHGATCLYVSGEESAEQIGVRARRVGADSPNLLVADESELPVVVGHLEEHDPDLMVIDSVQTLTSPQVDGRPGGVAQVLEVTQALVRLAKGRGMPLIVIGQSTRENTVAGPRALEHLVDTVLAFEGDRQTSLRLLRAEKNRYGPADEVACFEQTPQGLREVADPSELFRSVRDQPVPGTCVTITVEGRRPMLSEVQSLITAAAAASPRRGFAGVDSARAAMLLAVTAKTSGGSFATSDAFISTVGGIRLTDPAADLAICLALASSYHETSVPTDLIAIGEVTLSGDLRTRPMMHERVAEAVRLGYRTVIVPPSRRDTPAVPAGVRLVERGHLADVLGAVLSSRR